MRRSDMLYNIENLLAKNSNQIKACLYADVAEIILNDLELLGMLPPFVSTDIIIYPNGVPEYKQISMWED